jgi:hypothetical protein
MAITLESISKGKAIKAPRIVLLGVEGVGKSTFASQAESPIFLPMKGEQGIDQIDASKFPVARSYADVLEAIGVLYQDKHDFKTVVLDSCSALEPLIWEETCRTNNVDSIEAVKGGFGKGYIEALKFWREITDGIDALRDDRGIGCIFTGHVVTGEFNDPEADPYTTYTFDINKKAASWLYRWCDMIGFANFKRALVRSTDAGFNKKTSRATSTGQRVLYTEKRPAHPGKNRYGLPYEMSFDYATFAAAMDQTTNQAE